MAAMVEANRLTGCSIASNMKHAAEDLGGGMSRQLIRARQAQRHGDTVGRGLTRLAAASLVSVVVITLGSFALAAPAGARVPRLKKPGAPTNVVVTPTNGGADVSWSAPLSDGGSPITDYLVNASHFASCSTTGNSCSLTGLRNGHRYFVYVRAENAIGAGKRVRIGLIAGQSPTCGNLVPGADLEYCNFRYGSLAGDDLAGADFFGANLFHTDFQGADLSDASFTSANINDANFTDTTLNGTVFDTADPSLSDYIVSGGITGVPAVLPPDFNLVDGYLVGPVANLSSANLSGASLLGFELMDVNFVSADLAGADLDNADLTRANLTGADVSGTELTGVTWANTTCPDGTNSNNDADTCLNNLG